MLSDQYDERIKGIIYSHEPQRVILFDQSQAIFRGNNDVYTLSRLADEWRCNCAMWGRLPRVNGLRWCRHTLALERMLDEAQQGHFMLARAVLVSA